MIPDPINQFFNTAWRTKKIDIEHKRWGMLYTSSQQPGFSVVEGRYGGCHVVFEGSCLKSADLKKMKQAIGELEASTESNSLWIEVEKPFKFSNLGALVPEDWEVGNPEKCDIVNDYQLNRIRVWKWLNPDKECKIPPGATHNIGAQAVVIDNIAKKVLLVVEKRWTGEEFEKSWDFPGGCYDPEKDLKSRIASTAAREAAEETGVVIGKESLEKARMIAQRAFPKNQFAPALNQTYLFEASSEQSPKALDGEVDKAEWIDIEAVLDAEKSGRLDGIPLGKEIISTIRAAMSGHGLETAYSSEWKVTQSAV